MNRKNHIQAIRFLTISLIVAVLTACGASEITSPKIVTPLPSETVTDVDGNVYHTVVIGNQTWLVENLKTTHYRNGDAVSNYTANTDWSNATSGAYCDIDNTPSNSDIYGRLYNWHVVNDSRNICPEGWHIPSDEEWFELVTYLGGASAAGVKLKETGTSHWAAPNYASNSSMFTALPGGYRNDAAEFGHIDTHGFFWTSTINPSDSTTAAAYYLYHQFEGVWANYRSLKNGHPIRCVKD